MKYLTTLLVLFLLLITFVPITPSQVNVEAFIRKRTEEFMLARQARKGEALRKYYDVAQIKEVHEYLKAQYDTVKEDLKKGVFNEKYVRRSIADSTFGDSYKEALLKFLFKNADLEKELDIALTQYLADYGYKVTSYEIERIVVQPDNKVAKVKLLESRLATGQKKPQIVPRVLKWEIKNNIWLLSMDNTPDL